MKMNRLFLLTLLISSLFVFAGCGNKDNTQGGTNGNTNGNTGAADNGSTTDTDNNDNTANNGDNTQTDATTTASIVNTEEDFEKALSTDGTWIIAALRDVSFNKDLVLDGDFKNSKGETQRKIALYTQDENRVVTNRFTLTAPKLTVKSPAASIQHGTFKGDLYVETNDFQLVDATVDGNIYFISDDAKKGFTMDKESKVTGKQEVKK